MAAGPCVAEWSRQEPQPCIRPLRIPPPGFFAASATD